MVRKLAVILFVGLLFAALLPSYCTAQYYGPGYYYPPGYQAPLYHGLHAAPRGPVPLPPSVYRLAPNPYTIWRWDQHNRYEDYQQLLRSPLDRESALDYMLRTF